MDGGSSPGAYSSTEIPLSRTLARLDRLAGYITMPAALVATSTRVS
jgi:hypothetical protein